MGPYEDTEVPITSACVNSRVNLHACIVEYLKSGTHHLILCLLLPLVILVRKKMFTVVLMTVP